MGGSILPSRLIEDRIGVGDQKSARHTGSTPGAVAYLRRSCLVLNSFSDGEGVVPTSCHLSLEVHGEQVDLVVAQRSNPGLDSSGAFERIPSHGYCLAWLTILNILETGL